LRIGISGVIVNEGSYTTYGLTVFIIKDPAGALPVFEGGVHGWIEYLGNILVQRANPGIVPVIDTERNPEEIACGCGVTNFTCYHS
jgi:hypothetical protein